MTSKIASVPKVTECVNDAGASDHSDDVSRRRFMESLSKKVGLGNVCRWLYAGHGRLNPGAGNRKQHATQRVCRT